jgi:hypothetical protein
MSSRLRKKRNQRAAHVKKNMHLLALLGPGSHITGCSYGVHSYEYSEYMKTCTECGAVYFLTEIELKIGE